MCLTCIDVVSNAKRKNKFILEQSSEKEGWKKAKSEILLWKMDSFTSTFKKKQEEKTPA